MKTITIDDVLKAESFLKGQIASTPIRKCPPSVQVGATEIYLKCENEQITGSFKIRGALNRIRALTSDERARGVIASSAGNHAQGVAYGARSQKIAAHIVMPVTTPIVKLNATKSYGAEVILHGDVYDEAYAHARMLAKEHGYVFVHPYEDAEVIAGQGTLGLEILRGIENLDSIVVPIGGGGLISGIATAAKALNPKIKIIGVVSNQAPGMMLLKSHSSDERTLAARARPIATIAEGIAIKSPSEAMFRQYIEPLVDQIVEVDDNQIAQAIVFLLEKGKTVTEGAGAAGFAALLAHGAKLQLGQRTCVLLCGGNIDLNVMAKVIERGLRQEHRLARWTVVADDLPGNLNRLTNIMASERANILEVYHDRVSPELGLRETRIDLLVETASDDHIESISQRLRHEGFKIC